MGGSTPKPPAPPAPPRPDATSAAASTVRKPRGFSSTLLTSGMGDTSPAGVMKTLLGQ